MGKFLTTKDVNMPSQGSSNVLELVKHFETSVSFQDLQEQINAWFLFIQTDAIRNRPHIRTVNYSHYIKPDNPNKDTIIYLAQVHYILIGDANDNP